VRLPIFPFCCIVSEATLKIRVCFRGDAHRKSGVFSFGLALSLVESCSLQSPMSHASHLLLRSLECKRRDGKVQRRPRAGLRAVLTQPHFRSLTAQTARFIALCACQNCESVCFPCSRDAYRAYGRLPRCYGARRNWLKALQEGDSTASATPMTGFDSI